MDRSRFSENAPGLLQETVVSGESDLERLVQAGILEQSDISQRPVVFFAPEIMTVALRD